MAAVTWREFEDERENFIRLQALVDGFCREIVSGAVRGREELEAGMARVRAEAASLFPGRMELFGLIYQNRFTRLYEQFGPPAARDFSGYNKRK